MEDFMAKHSGPEKDDKNILAHMFRENNDQDYICCKQKWAYNENLI